MRHLTYLLVWGVCFLTRLCRDFGSSAFNERTHWQPRMDHRTLAQVGCREVSKCWIPFTEAELMDANQQSGRSMVVKMEQESHSSLGRPIKQELESLTCARILVG